jgi:hypothetical protein
LTVPLLLAACSSGSGSAEPEVEQTPEVRSTSELTLPLDAYALNEKEHGTVQRAAWRLIRDCVAHFGGRYTVPESLVLGEAPRFEHPHERRYGLFDPASAATRGYNVPAEQLPAPKGESGGWAPSAAELLLVRGPSPTTPGSTVPTDTAGRPLPEGGCQGESGRTLGEGAPPPANDNLGNELSVEVAKQAEGDSRVREAMGRWSTCMKDRGYSYGSVWEPNDRDWPEPAGPEEIATARADVQCKRETNLVGTWLAVERAYHERVIDERAEELRSVQDRVRALAGNAARVVNGG